LFGFPGAEQIQVWKIKGSVYNTVWIGLEGTIFILTETDIFVNI